MPHTKLYIPRHENKSLVVRPELTEWLNEGLDRKLTAITAPAGFGKTTSLTVWAEQAGCKLGWVSLDQHDNDMVRFWSYVVAAVRGDRSHDHRMTESISIGHQSYTHFIDHFIQELLSFSEDLALILDDYHVIDQDEIHESMAYLLEYLPANIHIYIACRTKLPFPTARLLTKGEMQVITMEDLRFKLEDVKRFFRDCMDVELSGEELEMLVQRTEGWISGLHLAGISIKKAPILRRSFTNLVVDSRGLPNFS